MSSTLFYQTQLSVLSCICVFALFLDRRATRKVWNTSPNSPHSDGTPGNDVQRRLAAASLLAWKYLTVYGIVMTADWLQGPYLYSLYREQYQLSERLVASLFVVGFISAGLAAPLIGVWADQHGRRKLCLAFCITYTLSCLCITMPHLVLLLLGRILGGTSTSILFSVFESWVISESTTASLLPADLSTILGRATLLNGFVAAGAGILSNQLVLMTSNFASPYMASASLLLLSWVLIRVLWTENYGGGGGLPNKDVWQMRRLGQACTIVRQDPVLLVLGLAQTCFEGSMYLFVFLWVPSLQESSSDPQLPLGYIFSSFMISMMLGSLLYTLIVTRHQQLSDPKPSSVTLHAQLSSIVCAVSALAFLTSTIFFSEHTRFWAFCLYEVCVGMYYPVQGTLRGALISNEHRATLSSLFRVPLNIFVAVSLLTGVSSARRTVLVTSAVMLTVSSLLTAIVIVDRSKEPQSPPSPRPSDD
ncbi:Molybdate-anion transporter [Psilocybe cubensis]|uniref:Molybdate-anion transporter n=2 Tax=Psilocybe cubensis TaxID=181762 RepID=A0ACB8GTA6_PSICU|nr:Molybdate-anion transporter [Psilocybe cubensis]KAH9478220.1 Molybdate-anion transporter [Psilocybe cubensis]